jgi:hypothetical protein
MVVSRPTRFIAGDKELLYTLDMRPGGPRNQSRYCLDETFFFLKKIEPRFLGRPIRSLTTTLAESSANDSLRELQTMMKLQFPELTAHAVPVSTPNMLSQS